MDLLVKRASIISLETSKNLNRGRRSTLYNTRTSFGRIKPIPDTVENSYRMMPDSNKGFHLKTIQTIMEEYLREKLSGVTYDSTEGPILSKLIANGIKGRISSTCSNRYKIVCLVSIVDKLSANLGFASRSLWYPENGDNVAEAVYDGSSLYAIATVHGLYYE